MINGDTSVQIYQNSQFTELAGINLNEADFNSCQFRDCDCTGLEFNGVLDTCLFKDCNLSLTSFHSCRLQSVRFEGCKLMGIDYTGVSTLGLALSFERCLIRSCNFNYLKMPNSAFIDCDIIETDFAGTDLSGTDFSGTGFQSVTFHATMLRKADFSAARNYRINPHTCDIKGALFSMPEAVSLLEELGILLV